MQCQLGESAHPVSKSALSLHDGGLARAFPADLEWHKCLDESQLGSILSNNQTLILGWPSLSICILVQVPFQDRRGRFAASLSF